MNKILQFLRLPSRLCFGSGGRSTRVSRRTCQTALDSGCQARLGRTLSVCRVDPLVNQNVGARESTITASSRPPRTHARTTASPISHQHFRQSRLPGINSTSCTCRPSLPLPCDSRPRTPLATQPDFRTHNTKHVMHRLSADSDKMILTLRGYP